MRVGNVLALRWKRISPARISIVERVYDGEFDDVKTDAGERDVPFDKAGVMMSALRRTWEHTKHRGAEDLVFANKSGKPLDTHNLLHRHVKPAAVKLGLARTVGLPELPHDARQPEASDGSAARGHARQHGSQESSSDPQPVFTKLVGRTGRCVSRAVAAVFAAPAAKPSAKAEPGNGNGNAQWVP